MDWAPEGSALLLNPPDPHVCDWRDELKTGSPVVLHAVLAHGRVHCQPTVLQKVYAPLVGIWLAVTPSLKIEHVQQRRFVRVPAREPVTLSILDGTGESIQDLKGVTHNLSGNGFRVACSQTIAPNTQVRVTIALEGHFVTATGVVVYGFDNPHRGVPMAERHVVAIYCQAIRPQDESRLVQFGFEKDRERRGRDNGW
jgi:c-di-GMP-binding flagellar brake protein YcgR